MCECAEICEWVRCEVYADMYGDVYDKVYDDVYDAVYDAVVYAGSWVLGCGRVAETLRQQ